MRKSFKIKNSKLSIPHGTLFSLSTYTYRTKDGRASFQFKYHPRTAQGKTYYIIEIISQPSYGSRDGGSIKAHWLSFNGGRKICFSRATDVDSFSKAQNFSMQWAELTHKYIQTGITIDQQVSRK